MTQNLEKNYQIITLDLYVDDQMVSSDDIDSQLNYEAFGELIDIVNRYLDLIHKHTNRKVRLLNDAKKITR